MHEQGWHLQGHAQRREPRRMLHDEGTCHVMAFLLAILLGQQRLVRLS